MSNNVPRTLSNIILISMRCIVSADSLSLCHIAMSLCVVGSLDLERSDCPRCSWRRSAGATVPLSRPAKWTLKHIQGHPFSCSPQPTGKVCNWCDVFCEALTLVHFLFTFCSLSVHFLFTFCSLSVHTTATLPLSPAVDAFEPNCLGFAARRFRNKLPDGRTAGYVP